MSVARILIADDHQLLADACKSLLEPEFTVVGIVLDGRALVNAAFILKPDVIIVDIGMPLLNGLDAGERIKREMPRTKLVFLSMNMDSQVAADAFRKGASAYVTKQSGVLELALAVRKAIRGESYLVTAADTAEMVAGTGAEHTGVGAELLVATQATHAKG
jgi:DNA-binding NarL/FixJ family response regulator